VNFAEYYLLSAHLVDCKQGVFAGVVLVTVGAQSSEYSIQQKGQASDPLHWQHEEGVQRQRLALGVSLQPLQNICENCIAFPEKREKISIFVF